MPRLADMLRSVLTFALLVNALDITTSLIPSPADHLVPVAQRSAWEWAIQLGALVPLVWILVRIWPRLVARYRVLPIPPLARAVLGVYFAIACLHVALRAENFPWSPVAMFSSAVPIASDAPFSSIGYVLQKGHYARPISFLREGNQWFAELGLGLDYKAGWALRLYAPTHSSARDLLTQLLLPRGLGKPVRVRLAYDRGSGRYLGLARMVSSR